MPRGSRDSIPRKTMRKNLGVNNRLIDQTALGRSANAVKNKILRIKNDSLASGIPVTTQPYSNNDPSQSFLALGGCDSKTYFVRRQHSQRVAKTSNNRILFGVVLRCGGRAYFRASNLGILEATLLYNIWIPFGKFSNFF